MGLQNIKIDGKLDRYPGERNGYSVQATDSKGRIILFIIYGTKKYVESVIKEMKGPF